MALMQRFGTPTYEAGQSSAVLVTVAKVASSFVNFAWSALTNSAGGVVKGDIATFTGSLIDSGTGSGLGNRTVYLMQSYAGAPFVEVASGVTALDGKFSIPYTLPITVGAYKFYVEWDGDDFYSPAQSAQASLTIEARTPVIAFDINPKTVLPGETLTWRGDLSDPKVTTYFIPGKTVYLQESTDQVTWTDKAGPVNTNSVGVYSGTYVAPAVSRGYYYRTRSVAGSSLPYYESGVSRDFGVTVGERLAAIPIWPITLAFGSILTLASAWRR